jgi:hypothetical protein
MDTWRGSKHLFIRKEYPDSLCLGGEGTAERPQVLHALGHLVLPFRIACILPATHHSLWFNEIGPRVMQAVMLALYQLIWLALCLLSGSSLQIYQASPCTLDKVEVGNSTSINLALS